MSKKLNFIKWQIENMRGTAIAGKNETVGLTAKKEIQEQ